MTKKEIFEIIGSAITLSVSLWIAFGPLRHRLPKFLTRLAKYSVALKLLMLSGLCWWGWYENRMHHGYKALRWTLFALALGLIGGALYVLSIKPKPPPVPPPRLLPPAKPQTHAHTLPHEPAQAVKQS